MDTRKQGSFSLGLKSVELQLQTLFADCGGDSALQLLDLLAQCRPGKQQELLSQFITTTSPHATEAAASDFEQELYEGLIEDFDLAASAEHGGSRLYVVEGGKGNPRMERPASGALINLDEARKMRKRG